MRRQLWAATKYIFIVIPFALIVLFIAGGVRSLNINNAIDKIYIEHEGSLELISYVIESKFEEYRQTLLLAENSNELQMFLADPSAENQENLTQLLGRIAVNREYIKGLTISTNEGQPLFGVTMFEDTPKPFENQLTYTAHWDNLTNVVRSIPPGQINFSPFSYTTHIVEGACLTLLGMQMPIYNEGDFALILGMLVDNQSIFSLFDQILFNHADECFFTLLDSHGILMYEHQNTSSLVPCGENINYAELYPALWEHLHAKPSQPFVMEDKHYIHQAFSPLVDKSLFYTNYPNLMNGFFTIDEEEMLASSDAFGVRAPWLPWALAISVLIIGSAILLLNYFRIQSKELLEVSSLVSDNSHDGVLILTPTKRVIYCNPTLTLISGFNRDEIFRGALRIVNLDGNSFALHQKEERWEGFVWLQGKRHITLTHVALHSVFGTKGNEGRLVALFSNPRNLARESVTSLLFTSTTQAGRLDAYPLQIFERKARHSGQFAITYVKIDNLDLLESQYSLSEHYHLSARLLRRIVETLSPGSIIIQYSPDTFLLALACDENSVGELLNSIHSNLVAPVFTHTEQSQRVIVSMGVSELYTPGSSLEELLRQSRIALAGLNHSHEHGYLQYGAVVNQQLNRYYSIVDAFKGALKARTINIHYQPVVSAVTNRIVGVEALARWTHPFLGPLSPSEFIPIVEEQSLERELGRYVIEEVGLVMAEIKNRGIHPISFSINLCPTELQDKELVSHLVETLDRHNLAHRHLIIELTERTLLHDLNQANRVLDELHANGIEVAIDDFGTGFSSLKYLHELNVDIIKIDRSFIKDYPDDEGAIFRAMVGMTKELNIPIMAEGIETNEQLHFIQNLQVPFYQGFLFSKAIDKDALLALLSS